MEFREIIVWLGLVAILVILWDGFRRMKTKPKKKAKAKAKAKIAKDLDADDDWEDPEEAARKAQVARELPNGGARIRDMTDDEKTTISTKFKLNLRERVPMLMERVVVEGEESDAERLEKESDNNSDSSVDTEEVMQSEMDFSLADSKTEPSKVHIEPTISSFDDESVNEVPTDDRFSNRSDLLVAESPHTDEVIHEDAAINEESDQAEFEAVALNDQQDFTANVDEDEDDFEANQSTAEPAVMESEQPLPVEDLIVVHLMAKSGGEINGRGLLELLVRAGLRHGPMDIFHYRNPQGKTEFSLANCVQPGTFNPDAMADVNTPGVTLFLQLPSTADAMESFEHMIEMARFMAANLDTDILDEEHSSVTPQVVEYYREKLRAFTRKQLIPS